MITKFFGKKHAQLFVKVLASLSVIYLTILILHSLSCTKTPDKIEENDDSIPARIKIGRPDKDGRVQFFASFDSKDLLRIWNNRPKNVPPPTPLPVKAPLVKYNLYNDSLCKDKNLEWILYILSSLEEFEKRKVLRETWADTKMFKRNLFQVIFVVGTLSDQTLQDKLVAEQNQHNDIVQGDFLDSSKAKSLKALLGMKWISEFCGNAKYALKANDASFINIFGIMTLVKDNFVTNHTIMCPLWSENQMPIQRDPKKCGAWCVKDDEFPGMTHFPQYCAGIMYMSTVPLLREIYEASSRSVFFWIEDVYITGVLAKNIKKPVDFIDIQNKFSLDIDSLKSQYLEEKNEMSILVSELTDLKLFRELWKSLVLRLPQRWQDLLSESAVTNNT